MMKSSRFPEPFFAFGWEVGKFLDFIPINGTAKCGKDEGFVTHGSMGLGKEKILRNIAGNVRRCTRKEPFGL